VDAVHRQCLGDAAIAARIGVNTSTNGTSSRAASERIASV
jgi:hypothetical protein